MCRFLVLHPGRHSQRLQTVTQKTFTWQGFHCLAVVSGTRCSHNCTQIGEPPTQNTTTQALLMCVFILAELRVVNQACCSKTVSSIGPKETKAFRMPSDSPCLTLPQLE